MQPGRRAKPRSGSRSSIVTASRSIAWRSKRQLIRPAAEGFDRTLNLDHRGVGRLRWNGVVAARRPVGRACHRPTRYRHLRGDATTLHSVSTATPRAAAVADELGVEPSVGAHAATRPSAAGPCLHCGLPVATAADRGAGDLPGDGEGGSAVRAAPPPTASLPGWALRTTTAGGPSIPTSARSSRRMTPGTAAASILPAMSVPAKGAAT